MSKRDCKGTWIVPANQVNEFLNNDINYEKLFAEALQGSKAKRIVIKKQYKPLQTVPHEELFELDIDEPGFVAQEKKKRFWNRDLRVLLKT